MSESHCHHRVPWWECFECELEENARTRRHLYRWRSIAYRLRDQRDAARDALGRASAHAVTLAEATLRDPRLINYHRFNDSEPL